MVCMIDIEIHQTLLDLSKNQNQNINFHDLLIIMNQNQNNEKSLDWH